MSPGEFSEWLQAPNRPPLIMGVLNVTPDSFSDGGRFLDAAPAVEHARRMVEDGADIIDVGGESTRPGAQRVDAAEQIRRVTPVIEALAGRISCVISIDTTRSEVARAALDAGAHLLNDISAGRDDPGMLELAATRRVPIVLMHMLGQPTTMQANPVYRNVIEEVREFLLERADAALAAGVDRSRILLDPGIGFGKTLDHNLTLLRHLPELAGIGYPLVLGVSRKAFIGKITGEQEAGSRLMGTAAAVAWSVTNGAGVLRVHDVEPMKRVIRLIRAIQKTPQTPEA